MNYNWSWDPSCPTARELEYEEDEAAACLVADDFAVEGIPFDKALIRHTSPRRWRDVAQLALDMLEDNDDPIPAGWEDFRNGSYPCEPDWPDAE